MWHSCVNLVPLLASLVVAQRHLLHGGHVLSEQHGGQYRLLSSHLGVATSARLPRSMNTSWTAGYDWNGVVDTIFSIVQREILSQGKDRIVLSDAENNFRYKFGFLTVRGDFRAWQGSLANLTNFRRSGDVSVVKKSDLWELKCALTLDDLRLRYERYELKVLGIGVGGHLEGKVDSNVVRMIFNFARTEDGGCSSILREVELTDLRGLKVDITGLGEFNGVGSAIATWMVDVREKEIISIINKELKREIENALQEFQCDEYISLLLL